MNVIRKLLKLAFLSAALVISNSPLSSSAAVAMVSVGSVGDSFTPVVTNINVGDSVIWTWVATIPSHSVLSTNSAPAFGSPTTFAAPHTFTNTFSVAGNYAYYCTVHTIQHMTGQVVVATANLPPTVTLTNPVTGTVFATPANVNIQASATDDGSVTNVQFRVDGNVLTNKAAAPFSAVTNNLAVGSHTLVAIASDNNGATATNQVTISVVTPVPMTFTAPKMVPPGKFRFTYAANTGLNYVVQRSTNLLSTGWTPLITNVAASSSVNFTDVTATTPYEFYRVGRLPNP
jgi:plastocyanin